MLGKNRIRKITTLFTVAAVWTVYSMVAFAIPSLTGGEITVTGTVTVNGQTAVSKSTITSGSTIVTGANSSAVISLGKSGRVEVLANSSMTLSFSDSSIIGTLNEGKSRFANAAGVATTVTTKHATTIAAAGQANSFNVEVECSHTHVDTESGVVTMREGTSDKQVAAGTSASAGNLSQTGCQPCLRPGSAPSVAIAGWPWLLLLAGGAAAAAVFIGTQRKDTTLGGGGVIVVSPAR